MWYVNSIEIYITSALISKSYYDAYYFNGALIKTNIDK